MLRVLKIALVTSALVLANFYVLFFRNPHPHGMIVDVKYRRAERMTALQDYTTTRSPETKAALDRELTLMHKHEDWKTYLVDASFLIASILIAYLFLKRESPRPEFNQSPI